MKPRYALTVLICPVLLMSFSCYMGVGNNGHVHQQPAPVYEKQAPPPWAPSHGYRAKHHYRYYPSNSIYFDKGRGLYFYYRDGSWTASLSIPVGIRLSANDFVTLEMDTDKPYIHHNEVQKRYPPGQVKKMNKRKRKKIKRIRKRIKTEKNTNGNNIRFHHSVTNRNSLDPPSNFHFINNDGVSGSIYTS